MVNFGQMPLLFDVHQLPEITFIDQSERSGQVGHMARAVSSEIVMLLRYLLTNSLWQQSVIKFINHSLSRVPVIGKNLNDPAPVVPPSIPAMTPPAPNTPAPPPPFPISIDYVQLCQLIGSLAVLG